jgi:AmmeMemoRadiSam system protein A
MRRSQSSETLIGADEVELLLDIADLTIAAALLGRPVSTPRLEELPGPLRQRVGAFVTLTVDGQLNGCIGNIEAIEPIGGAIGRLALSAAFGDPRLPPLRAGDYSRLTIELSLLSELSALPTNSFDDLRRALRPHHDGLVISTGSSRALFLPSVWDQLPDPEQFLDHLWIKAGLTPRDWPDDLRTFVFTAQQHHRRAGRGRADSAA